ncbi:MAG: hypothetical protein IT437_04425 [Phycisphaerales bacterium]|nr:hypothetical protein [Phycisphaerales bacterium]
MNHADRLERYLDGLLEPADRAEFERDLAASPELRERVDLQARINAGLHRLMDPAPQGERAPVTARRLWRTQIWLAAAAALAAAVLGVWWVVVRGPSGPDPLEAEYHRIVAAGFTPETVCTDDATFREWVNNKFGQPLQPRPDRGPVQYVGWNASRVLSTYSGLLLARVDGQQVVVLIDQRYAEDGRLPRPADRALHQFRRVVGGLILYEITPLDHPAVLDSLMQP